MCLRMRVIAGKYRSRKLNSFRGSGIRPTSDRLRETLFNILTAGNPSALENTVWIDLFAGTGAVGIEALSRGAKHVYFVDSSSSAVSLIQKNLQTLDMTSGFTVLQNDVLRGLWHLERRHVAAEVIFLDPPYRLQETYAQALLALAASSVVWAMSVVIVEHEKNLDPGPTFAPLRRFRTVAQGDAALSFYRIDASTLVNQ